MHVIACVDCIELKVTKPAKRKQHATIDIETSQIMNFATCSGMFRVDVKGMAGAKWCH